MLKGLIGSEVVLKGHPDAVCDQIADALLDEFLKQDRKTRAGIEVFLPGNRVIVGGEVTTTGYVDIEATVRRVIHEIGYTTPESGLDAHTCIIENCIKSQSRDIGQGVDIGGAGDNGFMIGYAIDETHEKVPFVHQFLVNLANAIDDKNHRKEMFSGLNPDGKIIAVFDNSDRDIIIRDLVYCLQEKQDADRNNLMKSLFDLTELMLPPFVKKHKDFDIRLNPTGRFVLGGPAADCSLTGRKLAVNSYGPFCPLGGGAQAGKDPTKVDRSGFYYARYIAKNLVNTGIFKYVYVQLSFAIGIPDAIGVSFDYMTRFGYDNQLYTHKKIEEAVRQVFPLSVREINRILDLDKTTFSDYTMFPFFKDQAPWERTDKTVELKQILMNHGVPVTAA